ncbi:MAG: ferrochelatase [Bacteroidetes bacterium]|nr:ferrochelatase [Bacteroidota bacterium]
MIKRGILLMNLGSPASTQVKDVRKYLLEFLMDKRVIDYPYIFRLLLVGGIIAPFRAPKSAEAYKKIWTERGSPLIFITEDVQKELEKIINMPVEFSMRYGKPNPHEAFQKLQEKSPDLQEVIAIPMYPHYAMSSYETAVEQVKEIHKKNNFSFSLKFVEPFYQNAEYIHALSESIAPYVKNDFDKILFSYHGLPERHLRKTDPTKSHCLATENCCHETSPAFQSCYRHQCMMTTELVLKELNIPKEKAQLSFQSRLGREEWLKPYTAKTLEEMPSKGVKKLIVVCPAFVSDCLETLEEIAMQGKETFLQAGGDSYELIPCLNTHPAWINALKHLVEENLNDNKGALTPH